MFLNYSKNIVGITSKSKQSGSMLVLAIFVLVVFLLLGTSLTKILASGDESLAYEIIGTRAYAAANTGAEFALQKLFPLNNNTAQACSVIGSAPNIGNVEGLLKCEISISCSQFITPDAVTHYQVVSTGQCDLDGGNVTSREIVVEARTL